MKKNLLFWIILFCLFNFTYAQNLKQEEITAKFDNQTKKLFLSPKNNTELLGELKDLLLKQENFTLFKISEDNPGVNIQETLKEKISNDRPFECNKPSNISTICNSVSIDFNCQAEPCLTSGLYFVRIDGLKNITINKSNTLVFEVDANPNLPPPKTSIESSIDGSRDKIRIKSDSVVTVLPNLQVNSEKYEISKDNKSIISKPEIQTAAVLDLSTGNPVNGTRSGDDFTLELDKPLSKGRTQKLSINTGIKDLISKNDVKTIGSITLQGIPPAPSSLNINAEFSFVGASGSKPVYDIDFKYDAQNLIPIRKCFLSTPCFFQPKIEVDLGFSDSKSDDTITIDLPFRTTLEAGTKNFFDPDDKVFAGTSRELRISNYYSWTQTDWNVGDVYFFLGPKMEFDKSFKRINALGSLRFDFRSYRWLGSISEKRNLLTGGTFGVEKEKADLVEINNGNTFIPYIGLDFGGRIKNEKVEIDGTTISEIIPKFKIFRGYIGFNNTLETQILKLPVNFTFEGRLMYLGTEERIATIVGNIIDIRKVKGFQHRGSFSFDLFFNQLRRYSFNITYENGRKAPSFEYLNKVTAGLKFRY